nr:methyl-accepting chemotaxis protein [uncultured Cohaesibacter sp.]
MLRLSNITLSKKIPVLVGIIALISVTAVSTLSIIKASDALNVQNVNQLTSITAARAHELKFYISSIREDLTTLATSEQSQMAVLEFSKAFSELGSTAETVLQKDYISDNSHPLGEKHKLDRATTDNSYNQVHARFHPWFRQFLEARGYYDIFLFDPNGNLVYTVFKELDYATNLVGGRWKNSDLSKVFQIARKSQDTKTVAFTDFQPYSPSHDAPASFMATPIIKDGKLLGVLAFQMPIGRINEVMQAKEGMGETGETYLVGEDHLMRSDSRFSQKSTILSRKIDSKSVTAALSGQTGVIETRDYRNVPVLAAYTSFEFDGVKWAIIGEKDLAEINAPISQLKLTILIFSLVILVGVAVLGWFVAKGIANPLVAIASVMARLSDQDFSVTIPDQDRKDEVGRMAKAVQIFKEKMAEAERLKAHQLEAEKQAEQQKKAMMRQLANEFEGAVGAVVETVTSSATELNATASLMAANAEETSNQATAVAAASEEATSNVQTVAAATEELSASVNEIGRQVAESKEISTQAVAEASSANMTVTELMEGARKIGSVVEMIQDIANQTNLLALNATIEAARAGEAGKGFAVVASEVKALASQTAKATDEIASQITSMQASTQDSVDRIDGISRTISKMSDISEAVAIAIEDQLAATNEIANNVQEAAAGTGEVSANIASVTHAAAETGTAAAQVQSAAAELATNGDLLSVKLNEFLEKVRTS